MEIAYTEALSLYDTSLCPRVPVSPPNRLETTNWDLIYSLLAYRSGDLEIFRRQIQAFTGARDVILAPSCRAAIAQILVALPHTEVVLPAYTCPVVKTAIEVARKRIHFVDISRASLNSTSSEFEPLAKEGRVLIPTHLFGDATDVENICSLARERGCVTIEDAAAAFGATRQGKALGTFADIGVFSFERSKRLPAFRGAAIIINNENAIDQARLKSPVVTTRYSLPIREVLHALFYNVATIPELYGRFVLPRILNRHRTASLHLGSEPTSDPVSTPFYDREFHAYQANLTSRSLGRFSALQKHISSLVAVYRRTFQNSTVAALTGHGCDDSALLRFPIAIPGASRPQILRLALSKGLYLETNYERILSESTSDFPRALWAANNVILLPLYRSLSTLEAERIANGVLSISKDLGS